MKAAMAGQKLPLRRWIASAWAVFQAYRRGFFTNVNVALKAHRRLVDALRTHTGLEPSQARILDVGCGQTATQTHLFHAEGARVSGVDLKVPTYRMGWRTFWRALRVNGVERAVKSLVRHLLYDRRFFAALSERFGHPISPDGLDVRTMSAAELEFPDNHFDFVYSNWVFEHIDDVPAAAREVSRVLKPEGVAVIAVHLFPSLSGGHNLEWIYPEMKRSKTVPPWDHLLDNRFPVSIYLNRLRLDDYRAIFGRFLETSEADPLREGLDLLTPEIERRLAEKGYTTENLLTREVFFVCRKRNRCPAVGASLPVTPGES